MMVGAFTLVVANLFQKPVDAHLQWDAAVFEVINTGRFNDKVVDLFH